MYEEVFVFDNRWGDVTYFEGHLRGPPFLLLHRQEKVSIGVTLKRPKFRVSTRLYNDVTVERVHRLVLGGCVIILRHGGMVWSLSFIRRRWVAW